MGLHLAAVVFSTWQAVILILLCFGSLIIALYCLFFMVPLRSFVERVNLLGGGMKGIESHLDGVQGEVERRIATVEELVRAAMREVRCELQEAIQQVTNRTSRTQENVQRLDRATQNLQAELRDAVADTRKLAASVDAMRAALDEIRDDFAALDGELRGAISQQVTDSYQKLESTVLSALEAVQDDMFRGTSKLRSWQAPAPSHKPAGKFGVRPTRDSRRRPLSKIISAEPLFADAEKAEQSEASHEEPADADALQTEGQSAPAK